MRFDDDEQQVGLIGQTTIAVPDDPDPVAFTGEADATDPLATILAIRDEAGEEALTNEEYALLMDYERSQPNGDPSNHNANLAEFMEERELTNIAIRVLDWVQKDENSRQEWYEREKKGIRALGVSPNVDGGANFKGASKAVHPLLAEAIAQFSARAMEVLWPSGGPVKSVVLGKTDDEREQQAKRVSQFMNYQYTELMPGAYEQTDKMLVRLPLSGSCFVKIHHDALDGVVRSLVEPADFIVPYRSTDLRTAPRYTERVLMQPNELKKRQLVGYYRNIEIGQPFESDGENHRDTVVDEIREAEGRSDQDLASDDHNNTLYECVCNYDLPRFEDRDESGVPTGLALPYTITIDRDSQKVMGIYRNWRPSDPTRRRVVYHIHYRFMPGLGFYGYGLYHWIGGLTQAATGALRALLDSAQFANMQGGYRAKDAALPNGDQAIAPGEWKEIDADYDDLKKAFFPIPYSEPSATLFNLLGHLEQLGQRFASTTEAMIGDGAQNTPVGTILARIEQGTKIHTAIQKRLHKAASEEFKLVAWLDSIYLPERYPFAVVGDDQEVFSADFDDRIDVLPVSDPNFASNTQRYFVAQALLELAERAPHLYNMREIHKRALESLRLDDIELLLPDGSAVPRMGPVEEGAAVMIGQPIKAHPEQNHQAHIIVHQQLLSTLERGHPAIQVLQAHLQEHMALAYLQQMQLSTGVVYELPQGNDGAEGDEAQIPVEMENQIAILAAQAVQEMQSEVPPDPERAEQERKDAIAQADIARKDEVAQAEQARKDFIAVSEIELARGRARSESKIKHAATLGEMRRLNAKAQAELLSRHGMGGR